MIVETSAFIDSQEDLVNTDKYGCWFREDGVYDFIRLLDPDHWLRKVLEKSQPDGKRCFVEDTGFFSAAELAQHSTRSFFLMNRLAVYYALSLLASYNRGRIIFINSFISTEILQVSFAFVEFLFHRSLPYDSYNHHIKPLN